MREEHNEPAYLRYVVERIATLRELPVAAVADASAANAARAFLV